MIMKSSLRLQQGFTLIEIMVVIVIMTVMASLVVLNIGGIDQRKAMQARELFILDLKRINKESADQSKVFALNFQNATDVSPFTYNLYEYHDQSLQLVQQADKTWQAYKEFKPRQLPDNVSFSLQVVDAERYSKANNEDLLGGKSPQLVWFGNGEVKPVRIQFYYQQQAIGNETRFSQNTERFYAVRSDGCFSYFRGRCNRVN